MLSILYEMLTANSSSQMAIITVMSLYVAILALRKN